MCYHRFCSPTCLFLLLTTTVILGLTGINITQDYSNQEIILNNLNIQEIVELHQQQQQQQNQQHQQNQQNQQHQQNNLGDDVQIIDKRETHFKDHVSCEMQLVETVPKVLIDKGLTSPLSTPHKSTLKAWLELIDMAKEEFVFVSQWAIAGTGKGKKLFNRLVKAVENTDVAMRIVYFNHDEFDMETDSNPEHLREIQHYKDQVLYRRPSIAGMTTPGHQGNVIHSKLFISDKKHFYIGSANLGSRSTTRTKELGMMVTNCPVLAEDAYKQWHLYWDLYGIKAIPHSYPSELSTMINADFPLKIYNTLDETYYNVYLGSSPKVLCAQGRTDDLTAIVKIIDGAKKFIHISIGEYVPMDIYKKMKRWRAIDNHLREAVSQRGIKLKFLVNDHAGHKELMTKFLNYLVTDLNKKDRLVEVKLFNSQFDIHKFHGSHNKFMVTDEAGFIGTSNWTEDYFTDTAGISIAFEPVNPKKAILLDQLEQVFQRDWNSKLADPLKA